jgi:hypothetical protein
MTTTHEIETFIRGTAFGLVNRFWAVDPLTQAGTLTNPDNVVLTIKSDDGTELVFVFGVDAQITNPSDGVFVAALDPQLPTGIYHYQWQGTGAVTATYENDFQVIDSSVDVQDGPTVAVSGPCSPWITGQDVANCATVNYNDQPYLFDTVAVQASDALYEISGRQFPGVCERTVRPCSQKCGCPWYSGPASYGFSPFFWTGTPWGFAGGWWWWNESGDRFGCTPLSKVRLAGYPVRAITNVIIDGTVLPEFDTVTGSRNWRLDKRRYLIRMDQPPVAPATLATPQFWPGCQNLSLDADQPGTFEITYEWGQAVPSLGKAAAVELANQLWLSCGGAECSLPAGVAKVTRQGIEIERGLLANWMDPAKPTGLVALDTFLTAYWGQKRGGRRSAVWSPDLQEFARQVGQ